MSNKRSGSCLGCSIVMLMFSGALMMGSVWVKDAFEEFVDSAATTTGTIVNFEERESERTRRNDGGEREVIKTVSHHPVVEFKTSEGKSQTFSSRIGVDTGYKKIGDEVEVLYDPDDPMKAEIGGREGAELLMNILSWQMIFWAVVLSLIAGVVILRYVLTGKRALQIADGRMVMAKVKRVEMNTNKRVNGKSPWQIVAEWQDPQTSKEYTFRSDDLWVNPSRYISGRPQVTVVIDPKNPQRYQMKTDFLPQDNR